MRGYLTIINFIFFLQVHVLFSNFQEEKETIILGAESIEEFIPLLENKKIGLVSNSSSVIRSENKLVHLLDTLLKLKQDVKAVLREAVSTRDADNLGLCYTEVIPLLTNALQEAVAKIETLETNLTALTTRVATLETS